VGVHELLKWPLLPPLPPPPLLLLLPLCELSHLIHIDLYGLHGGAVHILQQTLKVLHSRDGKTRITQGGRHMITL
jgi:hypothetical protein